MSRAVRTTPHPSPSGCDAISFAKEPSGDASVAHGRQRAFTLVEFLLALAIGAGVIAAAAIAFGTITKSMGRNPSYETVQLSAGVLNAFYGDDAFAAGDTEVGAYYAPSYGRAARAKIVRDKLYQDVDGATAVFCLARTDQTTDNQRPFSIPIDPGYDARQLDTPEAFRAHLAIEVPATASTFSSYRGVATAQNLSIFVLAPSHDVSELKVRAIYEVDFVSAASPPGVYASVRRYQNGVCSDFYDVFYPDSAGTVEFLPVVASFERYARRATNEGANDLFKVAGNRPFSMVWWPDPAADTLKAESTTTFDSAQPRSAYANMTGRTSFFMVLPLFPAL